MLGRACNAIAPWSSAQPIKSFINCIHSAGTAVYPVAGIEYQPAWVSVSMPRKVRTGLGALILLCCQGNFQCVAFPYQQVQAASACV